MRVLVDGQALQTGSATNAAPALVKAFGGTGRGWQWTLLEASHLEPFSFNVPASVGRLSFKLPHSVTPFDHRSERVNERYYGDWLTAQGADIMVVLSYFDPKAIVPRFSKPRPVVIGLVQELPTLADAKSRWPGAQPQRWFCRRFQALLDADILLVPSAAVEAELRELSPNLSARLAVSDDIVQALAAIGGLRLDAAAPSRKRIAWVSPLPPTKSGIADYSADLLPSVMRHYDIDLVIDARQRVVAPVVAARHLILTPTEAAQRHVAQPYDLFVYHVGNSGYHVYMLELMRRFRGLVVLHDFHVGALVEAARLRGVWPTTVEEELALEGETHLLEWKRSGDVSEKVLRQLVPGNKRLLSLADAVLVHSAWTWQRVRRLVDVPVALVRQVMPLTPRVDAAMRRGQLNLPLDAFIVCSLGYHGHTKRLQSLLRSVAGVRATLRRRILVLIVGPMAPADQDGLRRLAADMQIDSQLRMTGYVSMEQFYAYIQAADVCVQLRYPTNGETSASVLRALAAGAAVITSDQGPMAELPDDVVCKVRTPQYECSDVTALLEQLDADPIRRAALAVAGQRYVEQHLDPDTAAAGYAALIGHTIARRRTTDAGWCEATVAELLDSKVPTGPERDRLLADWAALREIGLAHEADMSRWDMPARKAG
jgi:glycosyltransferase involved in cell wall biosynthesis